MPTQKRATTKKSAARSVLPSSTVKPAATKAARKSASKVAKTAKHAIAAIVPARTGKTAWSLGAVALAAGAGIAAFLTRGRIMALLTGKADEGHVPTDFLGSDRNADDRAIADFRPNMAAAITEPEREALRPATIPAPTLVSDRGMTNSQDGRTT